MAPSSSLSPSSPTPADLAVLRAVRAASLADSRAMADPLTSGGAAEFASLYVDKANATWEEIRHNHQARSEGAGAARSSILPVEMVAQIAADYAEAVTTAALWSDQILAAAAEHTTTALSQPHTVQPALTWSLAYLLARDGKGAHAVHRDILETIATAQVTS